MVAVQENEKLCLDCSKAKFSINYKLNPDDFELDKNSEKRVDKVVEERFTKGKKHHKVNFEFKNCLDMGEKRENFIVGVEYIVSFLNNYPSPDMLRASIVHEFTHLYFFSELKLFSCEHEDDFYSRLDFFEDWIDKEMGVNLEVKEYKIGGSGTGKTSVESLLIKDPNIVKLISTTTRPPREGEEHSKDYYFISKEEFETELEKGRFLEHVVYDNNYYGIHGKVVDLILGTQKKNGVIIVDVEGMRQLKSYCQKQGTSDEEIIRRLIIEDEESEYISEFDIYLTTDLYSLEEVAERVKNYIDPPFEDFMAINEEPKHKKMISRKIVEHKKEILSVTDLISEGKEKEGQEVNDAEAYSILKLMEWLESNHRGEKSIRVYTDSFNNIVKQKKHPYLVEAFKVAKRLNTGLTDYYSRSVPHVSTKHRKEISKLLTDFPYSEITLTIPLNKLFSSQTLHKIITNLVLLKYGINKDDIDIPTVAKRLSKSLFTMIELTDYVSKEEDKKKIRTLITEIGNYIPWRKH
ncbi:10378_t:CDS:2 [Funneliformis geosporum]|nr:10378_t:CDS:2 [Funneliformis geosporum]